jgi:hypothetical protein
MIYPVLTYSFNEVGLNKILKKEILKYFNVSVFTDLFNEDDKYKNKFTCLYYGVILNNYESTIKYIENKKRVNELYRFIQKYIDDTNLYEYKDLMVINQPNTKFLLCINDIHEYMNTRKIYGPEVFISKNLLDVSITGYLNIGDKKINLSKIQNLIKIYVFRYLFILNKLCFNMTDTKNIYFVDIIIRNNSYSLFLMMWEEIINKVKIIDSSISIDRLNLNIKYLN